MTPVLVPASVSQRSIRVVVAAATAASVAVLLSPALCSASRFVDAGHLEVAETTDTRIDAIPEEYDDRFELLQPIPVEFEEVAPGAVIAQFLEADLAMTGNDRDDAKASLMPWIIDLFEDLTAAEPRTLGVTPAMQIRVLRQYLRHRQ